MAVPRIGGGGFALNLNGAFASQLPLPGPQTASATQFTAGAVNASNLITMPAGQVQVLPAGTFYVEPGPVTSIQYLDPITQIWRAINATPYAGGFNIDSDGGNIRLANLTGCPIGALITNAGTTYTNGIGTTVTGLTITPSSGGSIWVPVVGGANNNTVTITTAGSNYSFAPMLVCSPPPPGGIQMSAVCTVAAGTISTVTVTNQGAGYTAPATITVINDFRDAAGSGAVLTAGALVGSGSLTAMYPSGAVNAAFNAGVGGHGTPVTSVPTFTFAPASSTAATAVMNFVVTGITVTGGGSSVQAGGMFVAISGGLVTGASRAANTAGPIADVNLTQPRPAWISPTTAAGTIVAAGSIIVDPGFGLQTVPLLGFVPVGTTITLPTATAVVGGQTDTSWVQPF